MKGNMIWFSLVVGGKNLVNATERREFIGVGSVRIWPHYHEPIRLDPRDPQGPALGRAQVLSFFPSFLLSFFSSFLLSLFLSLESSSIVANRSRFFCEQMRP